MQAHVHTLATRQRSYCSRQRVCNRRQHRGNRRPFRLKGRTRGAPAYCSQVSTFGYYRWPLTKTSPARSWHRTNRLTGHAATACPRASSSRKAGLTPATTLSARICIRPVLSPFLYFPYAGLTTLLYPILGYLLLLYTQLISFWCRWTTVPTTLVCRLPLPGNGITRGGGCLDTQRNQSLSRG